MDPVAAALGEHLKGRRPRVLVTLGSGLGELADELSDVTAVGFRQVGLPEPTVPGHAGRFVAGSLHGVPVLAQQGRLHLYEGVSAHEVAAAVRAAAAVGVDTFVVTNAAGGLHSDLVPGSLVALTDQLNLTAVNPLAGRGTPTFVDMSGAYDAGVRSMAHEAAADAGTTLAEGVYAGVSGPAYETPAEVAMLRTLGADVVGMSTVTEVIAARAEGVRVVGLSLVTNVHDQGDAAPSIATQHADVVAVAERTGPRLAAVLRQLIPRLGG